MRKLAFNEMKENLFTQLLNLQYSNSRLFTLVIQQNNRLVELSDTLKILKCIKHEESLRSQGSTIGCTDDDLALNQLRVMLQPFINTPCGIDNLHLVTLVQKYCNFINRFFQSDSFYQNALVKFCETHTWQKFECLLDAQSEAKLFWHFVASQCQTTRWQRWSVGLFPQSSSVYELTERVFQKIKQRIEADQKKVDNFINQIMTVGESGSDLIDKIPPDQLRKIVNNLCLLHSSPESVRPSYARLESLWGSSSQCAFIDSSQSLGIELSITGSYHPKHRTSLI